MWWRVLLYNIVATCYSHLVVLAASSDTSPSMPTRSHLPIWQLGAHPIPQVVRPSRQ